MAKASVQHIQGDRVRVRVGALVLTQMCVNGESEESTCDQKWSHGLGGCGGRGENFFGQMVSACLRYILFNSFQTTSNCVSFYGFLSWAGLNQGTIWGWYSVISISRAGYYTSFERACSEASYEPKYSKHSPAVTCLLMHFTSI